MSKWMRQLHRWLSMAFTLAAIANIAALIAGSNAQWLGFVALVPLIFMIITGLYLFALPYLSRGKAA